MFLHIKHAKYLDKYKVEVEFSNGRVGIADLSEVLNGPVFEVLKDTGKFSSLKVDPELETIVWPNGADIAPEYIFYQAFKNDKKLHETFKEWGYIS